MKILTYIIFFSIVGTVLRIFLEHISDFALSPITYKAIPQIVGCFIFGLTVADDVTLSKGLQIGLAGSLTTFSGWMFSVFADFVNFYSVDRSVAASIYAGFLNILVVTAVAFSAFFFGIYSCNDRFLRLIRITDTFLSNYKIMFLCGIVWLLSLVLAILVYPICYALVLSPIGSLCRYYISLKLNKLDKIPFGTFLCNLIGTIILSVCLIISYYTPGSCVVIRSIVIGFCGTLTTLSSFVNELLRNDRSAFYFSLSIMSGLFFLFVIDGIFLLVLNIQSSNLPCF
jgi:fluoride ion exporter CrcB/FEX